METKARGKVEASAKRRIASPRIMRLVGMAIVFVASAVATTNLDLIESVVVAAAIPAGILFGVPERGVEEGFIGGFWRAVIGAAAGLAVGIVLFQVGPLSTSGFDISLLAIAVFDLCLRIGVEIAVVTAVISMTAGWIAFRWETRKVPGRKSVSEAATSDDPFGWGRVEKRR